jgi:hypothetical protein
MTEVLRTFDELSAIEQLLPDQFESEIEKLIEQWKQN